MANKVTGRKALFGNRRSHSLRATRHAQKVNLQKMTLEDGTKVVLSAREMRMLRKASKNTQDAQAEVNE